jgi:hypothetical protein
MSSKTAGERIAKKWIVLDYGSTHATVDCERWSLAKEINTAILRAVAADRRKRGKKTKGAKRWTRLG